MRNLLYIFLLSPLCLAAQVNQPYFAARAQATDAPGDLGSGLYRLTVTITDETAVYDGLDILDDSTFVYICPSTIPGEDINLYPVVNIVLAFASQVTVDVRDIASAGPPQVGSNVICEESEQGLFAYVSGAGDPINQAISDYNMKRINIEFPAGGGTTNRVWAIASSPDTVSIGSPVEGDVAYISTDSVWFRDGGAWLFFGAGGDGNGLISALPAGDVTIDASSNFLKITTLDSLMLETGGATSIGLKIDHDAKRAKLGDYVGGGGGIYLDVDDTNGWVRLGDVEDISFGTSLVADDVETKITLNADAGTVLSGTGYSYSLPTSSPSTTLNDTTVVVWRGTGSAATPFFLDKDSFGGAAADGDGIYSASGTIAPAAVATITSGSTFDIQNAGGSVETVHDDNATTKMIRSRLYDNAFDRQARVELQAPANGASTPYAGVVVENGLTSDYSSFEARETEAETNSTGLIRLAGDSLRVQNYARTSGYSLPVSTPSTTLNDTTIMGWRGTGAGVEMLGFIPLPSGGGGSGTVTSVGLSLPSQFSVTGSPVTTSGTLAGAWQNQAANTVLAGPASGGDAAPTFRALVAADVPAAVGGVLAVSSRTIGASVNDWVNIGSFASGIGNMSLGISFTSQIGGGEITKTYRIDANFIGGGVWYELSPLTSVKRTSHDLVLDLNSSGTTHTLRFRKKTGAGSGTIYFRVVDLAGNAPTFTPSTTTGSSGTATVWNPTATINSFTSYGGSNNVTDFGVGIGTQASTTYELNVAGTGSVNTTGGYYVNGALTSPLVHSITLGNTANDYVDFFNISAASGTVSLLVEISSQTSGHSIGKTYIVNRAFTASSTDWHELLPINAVGQAGGDIAYVAIQETGGTQITLRAVRRTGSGSAIAVDIRIYVLSAFSSYNLTTSSGAGHTSAGIYANVPLAQVNGNVGVKTASPRWTLDNAGTDGTIIGGGTTAQRGTGYDGGIRYNTTENLYEGYGNSAWRFFPYMDASKAQLIANNWKFNVDQSLTGLGNYRMSYNSSSDEWEATPSSVSTRGALNETVSTAFSPNLGSWKRITSLTSGGLSGYSATDSTLTYTGSTTHWARVEYSGSVRLAPSGSGSYQLRFTLFDNTTELAPSESKVQIQADAAETWIIPISGHYITQVISGHVFSLKVRGNSAANPELNNLQFSITAL